MTSFKFKKLYVFILYLIRISQFLIEMETSTSFCNIMLLNTLKLVSSAGYGVTSPHGYLSKAISVVYAMLGIPIYAVYLSYAYLAISNVLDAFCNLIFTCLR